MSNLYKPEPVVPAPTTMPKKYIMVFVYLGAAFLIGGVIITVPVIVRNPTASNESCDTTKDVVLISEILGIEYPRSKDTTQQEYFHKLTDSEVS